MTRESARLLTENAMRLSDVQVLSDGDAGVVLDRSEQLIPPLVREKTHLPYLGPVLDAGMATLFNYEVLEAIRYLEDPDFYLPAEDPDVPQQELPLE